MQKEIIVNGNALQIKEYKGQRVVTFEDVDRVHQRAKGTAKRNFGVNKEFFVENEDYFEISRYEFGTNFVPNKQIVGNPKLSVVLLTETGYLMLVKSLTDKLAWDVQRKLVKSYFNQKEQYIQPTMLDMEQQEKQPIKKLYHNGKPVMTASQISEVSSRSLYSIWNAVYKNNLKRTLLQGDDIVSFKKNNQLYKGLAHIYIFDYRSVLEILNELQVSTNFVDEYFMLDDYCFKHNKHQVFDNLITGFLDTLRFLNLGDIITQETIYLENTDDNPEMKSLMLDFFKMLKIRKTI